MKKFFIIIFLLFAISIIGLVVFLFVFDINRYKPMLIEKIEGAIQKDVRIANISLNFLPNLAFKIEGLYIKDTDKIWEDPLLKAASIEADIKLLPLLKKDIEIEDLRIRGLDLTLAKDSVITPPKSIGIETDNVNIGIATAGALKFLAKTVSIADSSISYTPTAKDSAGIKVDIMEALFENISLYGPIHINARLSVFGRGRENVRLKGILYPEIETKKPYIKNLNLMLSLDKLNLPDILNLSGNEDVSKQFLEKRVSGEVLIDSEKIYLDPKRLHESTLYLKLSKGTTDMLPLKDNLRDIEIEAEMSKRDILVRSFKGQLGKGTISANGVIKDIFFQQRLDFNIVIKDIYIDMLRGEVAPGKPYLEGILNMEISPSAKGLTTPSILDTITAKGTIEIDKAVLKNMNVLTMVFDQLDMLPGLTQKLKNKLPERYKEILKQNYTAFKPLKTEFDIKDGKMLIKQLIVESDAFYIKGDNISLDIHGAEVAKVYSSLLIPQDLSSVFIDVVDELRCLENSEGMLFIPLNIRGKFPNLSVIPDLNYIIEKVAILKGQELLGDIFKKERKQKKENDATSGSGEEGETQKQEEDVSPEEVLIKTIFDLITTPQEK